jgi:hypothetical protein
VSEEEDPFEFRRELEKAKTLDFSEVETIHRDDRTDSIEPSENAELIDLEKVKKTYKVQGYDLPEPKKPKPGIEKESLKKDDRTIDYKRNREGYRVMCPTCKGSKKCNNCGGRGRIKLIFKCKECLGTGICPDCDRDIKIKCPQCGKMVSEYSDTCYNCGLLFHCPKCYSSLPAMATRCMICKTEFECHKCGKPYPRAYSWRCPHCDNWNKKL